METILDIKEEIFTQKSTSEVYLTEDERNNILLDGLNEITKNVNIVNKSYLSIFDSLDKLSSVDGEISGDELKLVKSILVSLGEFASKTSIFFALLAKNDVIYSGCKSALTDLRMNIRSLREYLEDMEELFFLQDDNTEIDELVEGLI